MMRIMVYVHDYGFQFIGGKSLLVLRNEDEDLPSKCRGLLYDKYIPA